jgi:hypothetical protein
MACVRRVLSATLVLATTVGGCGLTVPEKDIFVNDNVPPKSPSPEGDYENFIIGHIRCEIANGVYKAKELGVAWFFPLPSNVVARYVKKQTDDIQKKTAKLARLVPIESPPPAKSGSATDAAATKPVLPANLGWGASVTLKIQVQEQIGVNPGVSLTTPLENSVRMFPAGGNVVVPQSFSLGLGLTGGATTTRVETISYTYVFTDLIKEVESCKKFETGFMIQSDLKIEQFMTDKATIVGPGEAATGNREYPPFSTFQDDITFVASYGGNATPTWKFARVTANSATPLIGAARTSTNEVIITLGPVASLATPFAPAQLTPDAQAVHGSSLIGSATGSATNAQTH